MSLGSTQTSSILSSLHLCRWEWCRASFDARGKLADHIIHEHINRAIPVRRRDIPLIRRAEEGTGESLGLSKFMPSGIDSSQSEPRSQSVADGFSLPSPPASTPSAQSPLFTQSKALLVDDAYPSNPFAISAADLADEPPTFASLSSPAGSFISLDIPPSPAFSAMVHATKRRKLSHSTSPTKPSSHSRVGGPTSQESPEETSSQASVAMHLTQRNPHLESSPPPEPNMDDFLVEDSLDHDGAMQVDDTSSTRLHWTNSQSNPRSLPMSSLPPLSQPPSQLHPSSKLPAPPPSQASNSPLPSQSSRDPVALTFTVSSPPRQSWYQTTRPVRTYGRKSKSPLPELGAVNGTSSATKVNSQGQNANEPIHLQSPLETRHTEEQGRQPSKTQDTSQLTKPDQHLGPNSYEEDSLEFPAFFPPIQTQAPYQSQSQGGSENETQG